MQQYFVDTPLHVGEDYISTKEQAHHAKTGLFVLITKKLDLSIKDRHILVKHIQKTKNLLHMFMKKTIAFMNLFVMLL